MAQTRGSKLATEQAVEAWKEKLREKSSVVRDAFSTEAGQKLEKLLIETFEDKSLKSEDPHETYYRLGQRDVVQYLRELKGVTSNV